MIDLLRLAVAGMGILLLIMDFMTLVYRKITESLGLCWFFLGGVLIFIAVIPGLNAWVEVVPKEAVPALILTGAAFLLAAFYVTSLVSQLLRKNQELAMHVSLLNQENESVLNELKELQKHENTVCH